MLSAKEIFNHIPAGLIIFDERWDIVYTNKTFREFPFSKEQSLVEDKNIFDLLTEIEPDLEEKFHSLKKGKSFSKLLKIKELQATKLYLIKASSIIEFNKFHGGILLVEDISSQRYLSNALLFEDVSLKKILESVFDHYDLIDSSGGMEYKNSIDSEYRSLTGKKFNEIFKIIPEEDICKLKDLMDRSIKKQESISQEFAILSNSKMNFLNITSLPITGDEENPAALILTKDVTSEKLSGIILQKEFDTLRENYEFFERASDAIFGLSNDGNIVFCNKEAENLFGISSEEIYSKFIGFIIGPINRRKFNSIMDEIDVNQLWEGEAQLSLRELNDVTIYLKMHRIEGASPNLALICSKMTPRQIEEKRINQAEKKFRSIVENSPDMICSLDREGKVIFANEVFKKRFNFQENDFEKKKLADLMPHKTSVDFNLKKVLRDETDELVLEFIDKKNKVITANCRFILTQKEDSKNIVSVIIRDITDQNAKAQRLELLNTIFSESKEGIAVQFGNKFNFVNKYFSQLFNIHDYDLDLIEPLSLFSEQDQENIREILRGIQKGKIAEHQFEFRGKRKNGEQFFAEAFLTSDWIGEDKFIFWEIRDISDNKFEKKLLEESDDRFRSISENIRDVIWSAEKTQKGFEDLYYNSAVSTITGYEPSEFIENKHLWHRIIHPDDVGSVINKIKTFYKNIEKNSEEFEYRIFHKKGYIVWLRNEFAVLRKSNGEVIRVLGIVSDITPQKNSEEELQKNAANLKQLNETKDKFISIISHDLRSPFNSILGFADMLLENPDAPLEKRIEQIKFIKNSSQNLLNLINSLFDWTRLQTGRLKVEPEKIDASKVVDDAISLHLGNAIKKNIELRSKLKKDLSIYADPNLLLQVFNNLISNAIKFTNEGGIVEVNSVINPDERYIEFVVKDNGVGISREDQSKLLRVDTKLTTPGTAGERGSGLGLSFCNEIVRQHGGKFRIESEVGLGSSFYFTLPHTSSNILLVDNSSNDRILYTKLINNLLPKLNVIEAADGEEAINIINESSPALVISEHEMPNMDGLSLVKRIKLTDMKYRPPVIILSSYINEELSLRYKKFGVEFIFMKPVNLTLFKQAIEKELKKPATT